MLPHDVALPALGDIAARGIDAVMADVGVAEPVTAVEVLKYHEGERITFAIDTGRRRAVVKCFAHAASPLVELFRWFDAVGLASGVAPTVPPVIATDDATNVVVTEWLDGTVASELAVAGHAGRAGELAAAWLSGTNDVMAAGRLGVAAGHGETMADVNRYVRTISKFDGALGARAAATASTLATIGTGAAPAGIRHGGYYLTHVFDVGGGPAIIDWDTFCQGPVELDIGMFLAMVSRWAKTQPDPRAIATLRHAFLAGVEHLADSERLAFYRSAFLLKMTSFLARRQPEGWAAAASQLLDEAGDVVMARDRR